MKVHGFPIRMRGLFINHCGFQHRNETLEVYPAALLQRNKQLFYKVQQEKIRENPNHIRIFLKIIVDLWNLG